VRYVNAELSGVDMSVARTADDSSVLATGTVLTVQLEHAAYTACQLPCGRKQNTLPIRCERDCQISDLKVNV
jgi:hypothetical protein